MVVHRNHLEPRIRGRERRTNAANDVVLLVPCGNHDRDERPIHRGDVGLVVERAGLPRANHGDERRHDPGSGGKQGNARGHGGKM